ncbi:glycosyltransferase [Acinetobacter nectaris]|uniref:glycosyltransferase n=1 Tax=Acinetobacter nectaris TaxID=1219382 RepID=UPI001F43BCC3|nr:glycosyltransferase [Acinetobacter nectaris]MCF9047238.1 glycosyltransferase [Acinetobacter nectaris]
MKKTTICLNMIVKNEADIIVETLDNIRSSIEIDYVVICDTGSSDGTQDKITNYLKTHHIQGEVHEHTWKDFAYNRNLALSLCDGKADYVIVFDADDRFHGEFRLPQPLTDDIYHVTFKSADREFFYTRKILFKNNNIVKWVGVLHESIINIQDQLSEIEIQGDYYIQTGHFGARSQDPQKYLKDAQMLTQAFENESEDLLLKARYAYYAATSYYSYNDITQAIFWFKQRIEYANRSSNTLETYLACRHLGSIYKEQQAFDEAIVVWLKGCNVEPLYLECLYELSLLCTERNEYHVAYDFALLAKQKKIEKHAIALETRILNYGIDYQVLSLGLQLSEYHHAYLAWRDLLNQPFYSKELTQIILNHRELFYNNYVSRLSSEEQATIQNALIQQEHYIE